MNKADAERAIGQKRRVPVRPWDGSVPGQEPCEYCGGYRVVESSCAGCGVPRPQPVYKRPPPPVPPPPAVIIANGDAPAPALSFSNDSGTGPFRFGRDSVAPVFGCGGTLSIRTHGTGPR